MCASVFMAVSLERQGKPNSRSNSSETTSLNKMTQPGYALVTGASRRLGRSFARTLAGRNQNLVLVARSEDKLQILAKELTSAHGVQVDQIAIDLAKDQAGLRLGEQLLERDMRIDLLVNNAGFGDEGWFLEMNLARQMESVRLQNATVVELVYKLVPPMIERRQGGVINVSSLAGLQPIPYATIYSSAKAFLTSFSLALESEIRRYGVAVVTVCPGRLRVSPEDIEGTLVKKTFPGGEQSYEEVVNATLRKLAQGGGLVIPGTANKLLAFAERLIPRSQLASVVGKMSKPKRNDL